MSVRKNITMAFAISFLFMVLLRILQKKELMEPTEKGNPRHNILHVRNSRKLLVYESGYGTKNNLIAKR